MLTILTEVMSIGSGVSVSVQTANGLGRDVSTLSRDQLVAYQKVHPLNWLLQWYEALTS